MEEIRTTLCPFLQLTSSPNTIYLVRTGLHDERRVRGEHLPALDNVWI
jgi:hypothetical protein